MKECVIITNQEEWDFVSEKLGYKWLSITFEKAIEDCNKQNYTLCINLHDKTWANSNYYFRNEYIIHTFNEWLAINNLQYKNQITMKEIMLDVLEKTYNNPILRQTTVPLFMSNPGIGKTSITEDFVKEFVESKGNKMVTMVLPNLMPNECVGGVYPNAKTKVWEFYDSEKLSSLKDGDCLFLDEVFNGTLKQTLDAMLNVLGQRRLGSGKKMADVMIVAASNPQGLINLTPQIKQRFIRYDLKFNAKDFQQLMYLKYGMVESISKNLCLLINKEKFENTDWDYMTPRSIQKAINQIGCDLSSSYDELLLPILNEKIPLDKVPHTRKLLKLDKDATEVEYVKLLKLIVQNDKTNKK
jgi:hypothetical protein